MTLLMSILVLGLGTLNAQTCGSGAGFIDENGDGYYDLAPDSDGDGIPNGLDPDYVSAGNGNSGSRFVDENGDGINDNAGDADGDGIINCEDDDFTGTPMNHAGRRLGLSPELRGTAVSGEASAFRHGLPNK